MCNLQTETYKIPQTLEFEIQHYEYVVRLKFELLYERVTHDRTFILRHSLSYQCK